MMDARWIARFDGVRVPRYTSYPTAPHFTPAVGAATYLDWLGRLTPDEPVSLYVHLPFCAAMCWYCGCHTRVVARYQPIADYLALLQAELALVASVTGRLKVAHVHFGGGTPTMVSGGDLCILMDRIRSHFDLLPEAEIAIEIDPRTLEPEMPAALARMGVTRASLGVQDLSPQVQQAINRVQPFAVTEDAVLRLRRAGIAAINVDLMYGLPHQDAPSSSAGAWRVAKELQPDRLAVFGYAHVPWMKTHQRRIDESALPGPEARWVQFAAIADALTGAGYDMIGLDHFARADDPLARAAASGLLRRNFQGYTTDATTTLLGFGASSIGCLPQGYVQNDPAHERWARAIADGKPATLRGIALSAEDRMRREIIERLMCDLSVDPAAIAARHGMPADTLAGAEPRLAALQQDGIVMRDGTAIRVPDGMRPLVRLAASAFDSYLDTAAAPTAAASPPPPPRRHAAAL